jgi:hypothetical protein
MNKKLINQFRKEEEKNEFFCAYENNYAYTNYYVEWLENKIEAADSSRIHYESKNQPEPKEEGDWISVDDEMPKEDNTYTFPYRHISFKTKSGKEYNGYVRENIFYNVEQTLAFMPSDIIRWKYKEKEIVKEVNEWISVDDRMPEEGDYKMPNGAYRNALPYNVITFKTKNGEEYNGFLLDNIFHNDHYNQVNLAFIPSDISSWKYYEKKELIN